MPILGAFDPLTKVQEILVVALGIVALSLVYVYWHRVIQLLTGDDRLHCSSLDIIWTGCCRCCGLCSGEWTRNLSKCPCFPARLRGKNLVRQFGKQIGFVTHSIEIKNITVGDLPFDRGRGDFYLSVEASTNPPMVTSCQEEKLPKVVHFPEIISLKIRDSPLEPRVRIVVKELNVIGSVELADCHLSASSLCDWANIENIESRVMRFTLRPCDNSIERETPAWILLELSESDDVRGVDGLPNVSEGSLVVRTWVPTEHETVKQAGAVPIATTDANQQGGSLWRTAPRQNVDLKVGGFKGSYSLLDDAGNPVAEPTEDQIAKIRRYRKFALCIFVSFQTLVYLTVFSYLGFRFYVWSCYRRFRWLTIVYEKFGLKEFPIASHRLHEIVNKCHKQLDGTGAALGQPCRPNAAQIEQVCVASRNEATYGPRPEAFQQIFYDWFGIELKKGLPCFEGVCEVRNKLMEWDVTCYVVCFCLFIATFCLRYCLNQMIKKMQRDHQASNSKDLKRLHRGGS